MRTRSPKSPSDPMPSGGGHRTVLLHEAVDALSIQEGDVVVDATLGGGGHAKEILKRLGREGVLIGFDADAEAIERVHQSIGADTRVQLIHSNFRHMKRELEQRGHPHVNTVLFDLGWSGYQLTAGRGFSFLADEPLDMAYGANQLLNAAMIVHEWQEESIADVMYGWGEERYARRIARAIVEARQRSPIKTSRELAEIIKASVPAAARFGKTHPATKAFQALRIAVNDELGALEEALRDTWHMLAINGRIVVITFHSLEDGIVKRFFASLEKRGEGKRVTKKPLVPSDDEIASNPRARSAKMRVIEKTPWDTSQN